MLKIVDINNTLLAYLNNVINPSLSEKINNSYTLTFSCVIEDLKTDYIQYGNRIEVENQLFNIVTYSKERTNDNKLLCSVYCEHISYELIDDSILFDYYNITATQALSYALQGTNFNVGNVSDLGNHTFQRDEEEINRRAMLFSIAKAYSGELYFNNFEVSLFSMRGANNGVQIRLGKNLKGIKQTVDAKKKDSEGNPYLSYEIDFVELDQLDIYKGLEAVRLGDTIKVIDEGLNIDVAARILEYEYDPILKRNSRVVLGNFVEDIASYNSTVKMTVDEVEKMKDIWNRSEAITSDGTISTSILEGTINTLQNEVMAGLGTVKITENNGILITDNPDDAQATKALRLLGGVLAISNEKNQSGEWIWRTFGTGDGFIADEIISGTIWTNLISIVGNSDNPNAFKWDSNGLKVHKINLDNTIDYNQYVILDNNGLRFTQDGGNTWVIDMNFASIIARHNDGSETILDGEGFKRKILSNGNTYNYINLLETGQSSAPGTLSAHGVDSNALEPYLDDAYLDSQGLGIAWIQLTNPDFIGRNFVVVPSYRGIDEFSYFTSDSGSPQTDDIEVEVLDYDYVNAKFKIRARKTSYVMANWLYYWDGKGCKFSYTAFATN